MNDKLQEEIADIIDRLDHNSLAMPSGTAAREILSLLKERGWIKPTPLQQSVIDQLGRLGKVCPKCDGVKEYKRLYATDVKIIPCKTCHGTGILPLDELDVVGMVQTINLNCSCLACKECIPEACAWGRYKGIVVREDKR